MKASDLSALQFKLVPSSTDYTSADIDKLNAAVEAGEIARIGDLENFPVVVLAIGPDGHLYRPIYFPSEEAAASFCEDAVGALVVVGQLYLIGKTPSQEQGDANIAAGTSAADVPSESTTSDSAPTDVAPALSDVNEASDAGDGSADDTPSGGSPEPDAASDVQ